MSYLSTGMALVRQWFPDAVPKGPESTRSRKPLAIELDVTVGIERAGIDRIEASIAGRIRAQEGAETRVGARRRSSGALAEAEPFAWLQLLDDHGAFLTHETFLGRGVGIEYRVHARIELPTIAESPRAVESDDRARPARRSSPTRLASGLHARVVTRTYRNASGPRYYMEVLTLPLLAAHVPFPAVPMVPALALAPGPHRSPARVALAEASG
jgi:hypothetical protein